MTVWQLPTTAVSLLNLGALLDEAKEQLARSLPLSPSIEIVVRT